MGWARGGKKVFAFGGAGRFPHVGEVGAARDGDASGGLVFEYEELELRHGTINLRERTS